MAILVAVGGAALGSSVGVGAQAGWLVGSIVGQLLFPSGSNTTQEGPRLGDLSVTSSAYGQSLPIVYGAARMGGNIIWAKPIEEVKDVNQQSGKGGGATATTVTYRYFATFAIAFCEGPADTLIKIWGDGKLLYDATGEQESILKKGLKIRFYKGDEEQEPDGIIQADLGAGATPAHRGICYIVFDALPLADFGNRIPNITAEISFATNNSQSYTETTLTNGSITGFTGVRYDSIRELFYQINTGFIRVFNANTMQELRGVTLTGVSTSGIDDLFFITRQGYLCFQSGSLNSRVLYLADPNSLQIVANFGTASGNTLPGPTNMPIINPELTATAYTLPSNDAVTTQYFGLVCTLGTDDIPMLFNLTDGSIAYVWDESSSFSSFAEFQSNTARIGNDNVQCCAAGLPGQGFADFFVINRSSGNMNLHRIRVTENANYSTADSVSSGVTTALLYTYPDTQFSASTIDFYKGLMLDQVDGNLIFFANVSTGTDVAIKINPTTGAVVWTVEAPGGPVFNHAINDSVLTSGQFGYVDRTGTPYIIRTADGVLTTYSDYIAAESPSTNARFSFWDSRKSAHIALSTSGVYARWKLGFASNAEPTAASIISDLCTRVGIAGAQIDTTDLTSLTLPGYTIGRIGSVRSAIEPLASLLFFDGIESDFALKFVQRDAKTPAATILQEDLAPLSSTSGEWLTENRIQEVDLPSRFSITYIDKDRDYQSAVHNAKRILNPTDTSQSRNELSLEIAAAVAPDTAKQSAEKALISSWIERSNYSIKLPWQYLTLDPSDVITVTTDIATFRMRVAEINFGADLSLEVNALSEDAAQYTSNVPADGGQDPVNGFTSTSLTNLILIDGPLLRDTDDTGRTSSPLYYYMGPFTNSNWPAGLLYQSRESTQYEQVGSTVAPMTWGSIGSALPNTNLPFSTDETTQLTVFLNRGTLTSISQLEMLNGGNAAAIIPLSQHEPEIIQFRDVTLNADGSYTLSGILRGRRGTEYATGLHAVGDIFVLLETSSGDALQLPLADLNSSRFYKGVTSVSLFDQALTTPFASTFNALRPYAPVQFKSSGSWGSDITITWARRTRLGGELQNGLSVVPLNEDSEEYDLLIYVDDGTTLLRTVTGLTAATYTYTMANQASDLSIAALTIDRTNLLTNPSFELGNLTGWTAVDPEMVMEVRSTTAGDVPVTPDDGTYFLSLVERDANSTNVSLSQNFDITSLIGESVTASVSVLKQFASAGDGGQIGIEFFNSSAVSLGAESLSSVIIPPNIDFWQTASVTATVPATAATMTLTLYGIYVETNRINIVFDNVQLIQGVTSLDTINVQGYQISAQVGRGHPSKLTELIT